MKYYERLLTVGGMLVVFFVITMLSVPLLSDLLHIDRNTREGMLALSAWQAVVLFILPSLASARIISRRPAAFLELNRAPTALALTGALFAYLIFLPALNQIIYWNSNIEFPEAIAVWGETLREMEESANAAATLMLNTDSWVQMLVNLAVVALLTAFAEELFFRGTLQRAAASAGARHTAIWVVAFFFSAMHFQVFGFIPRLLLGAWFGYLLLWTRSVYVPVFAHFINNGAVVVCAWLSARGVDFDFDKFGVTEYGFPMAAFISAVATVVFIIYFKNFFFQDRREGKREKRITYA